ncbi:hypothetical protein [Sinorhizobium alkalisoli]|uniref:Uncharacterized protein n=1 Tax=Sinorhizobium alkalisoli TaxID=1752398 RepID=A0A1E3VBC8_9HYPH|nr:hypothetical protein [Sinorhizobium alkalisoli]ODR90893.1 hypothetical protein A8M32_12760 [Sinorhizobium alkalisoli]
MRIEVLGLDYDKRISSFMVNARADYEWYLSKTQGSEENLQIQRDIIRGTKPYKNLRADLKLGCILPTIVLAVRHIDPEITASYNTDDAFIEASAEHIQALTEALVGVGPNDVDIVDGLQRTNALRQTLAELEGADREAFLRRSLRLEIWINIPFYSLAYRMLLLNAGQRPMSMKHQIDILSGGLAEDLKDIQGIEIIRLKDHKRRVRPGQFHLSTLAQAFQAWMQRSPNVDRTNLVVETMAVDEALESLGIDLNAEENAEHRDGFREFVSWIVQLDTLVGDANNRFFGNDTVVLGFAAAAGFAHKNETLNARLKPAMASLLEEAADPDDPLGINIFEQVRKSIDTKKSNVGEATRDLVFRAVREYILQAGTSRLADCWAQSASMV